jgi:hypothetical protein
MSHIPTLLLFLFLVASNLPPTITINPRPVSPGFLGTLREILGISNREKQPPPPTLQEQLLPTLISESKAYLDQ